MTPVGYSYWRNSNAHEGSNDMWIFLSLNSQKGGSGPTLFRLTRPPTALQRSGRSFPRPASFPAEVVMAGTSAPAGPNQLYINDGPKLLRYDVTTHTFETVFDLTGEFGSDREVWQMHSSNDDLVHSATLRAKGLVPFWAVWSLAKPRDNFPISQRKAPTTSAISTKAATISLIVENIDGRNGSENVIVDLQTGVETVIYDEKGGVGHADMGYNYVVGADGYSPSAQRLHHVELRTFVGQGPYCLP